MEYELPEHPNTSVVLSKDEFGFEAVIDDFNESQQVIVVTYGFHSRDAKLIEKLRDLKKDTQLTVITNIPGRFEAYSHPEAERRAQRAINAHLDAMNPNAFGCQTQFWFCFKNHAKIVATENLAYIGSQNYTSASEESWECGVLIRGRDLVSAFVPPIIEALKEESHRYHGALKERFILQLTAIQQIVSSALKRTDAWFRMTTGYGGEQEESLDLELIRRSNLNSRRLLSQIQILANLIKRFRCFKETENVAALLEASEPNQLLAILESPDFTRLMEHDRQTFIDEMFWSELPSPDDESNWFNNTADLEADTENAIWKAGESKANALCKILEKLNSALVQALTALAQVELPEYPINNTASRIASLREKQGVRSLLR